MAKVKARVVDMDRYEVLVDDELVGTVWYAYQEGHWAWKRHGIHTKCRADSRDGAIEALVKKASRTARSTGEGE